MKTLSKLARALAALIALGALTSLAAAPASATGNSPNDFAYDSATNELVGTYTDPSIANASDFVTGSISKPIVPKIAVIVIFSGPGWTDPKKYTYLLPSYVTFLTELFNSPYFTLLSQYGSTNVDYVTGIVDSSPASVSGLFIDAKIQTFVNLYLTYKIPIPAGYRPFYLVVPTPGSGILGSGEEGEHFQYTAPGGVSTVAGWAVSMQAIAHEIVETITDPTPGQNWLMDRSFAAGESQENEIADAGAGVRDNLPGTGEILQPYWSQSERACVIPAGTPRQAAGDSLTSYFDGTSTHVFYVSTDRHVRELIGTGSPATWTTDDPVVIAGAPLTHGGSGLTSFWDPIGQVGHVFYLGPNSDVEELYHLNGSWFPNDLEVGSFQGTPLGAEPRIEGDRALTGFFKPADDTEHVYYEDSQAGISEFKWTPTTGWITDSVSNQLGLGSQLSVLEDGTEHIFYKDPNNHVSEAAWNGTTWPTTDWSANFSSGVALPGNDALATVSDPGVFHVFYIDTANHVRELVRYAASYWSFDLTASSGDTSTAGSPALTCYRDTAGKIHVFYIGQDQVVHEYVRTAYSASSGFFGPQYSTAWTTDKVAAPFQRPSAVPSRLLTSCYDPVHLAGQVFDLSLNPSMPPFINNSAVDSCPVGAATNIGGTWLGTVPSSLAGAPVAFP